MKLLFGSSAVVSPAAIASVASGALSADCSGATSVLSFSTRPALLSASRMEATSVPSMSLYGPARMMGLRAFSESIVKNQVESASAAFGGAGATLIDEQSSDDEKDDGLLSDDSDHEDGRGPSETKKPSAARSSRTGIRKKQELAQTPGCADNISKRVCVCTSGACQVRRLGVLAREALQSLTRCFQLIAHGTEDGDKISLRQAKFSQAMSIDSVVSSKMFHLSSTRCEQFLQSRNRQH